MPVISMFYGILIRMYSLDSQHHNLPHRHARNAEFEASSSLGDGEVLGGELPRRHLRRVQAWIELHREELMTNGVVGGSRRTAVPYRPALSLAR